MASKAQQAVLGVRRSKALALRLAGCELETIVERLGYRNASAVAADINASLAQAIKAQNFNLDLIREQEAQRLNRLQTAIWPAAMAGDPRAVETVLKIMDRRAKMHGIDQPTRVEILTIDQIDAQIAELQTKLEVDGVIQGEIVREIEG